VKSPGSARYEIAQLNVAKLIEPIGSPLVQPFVDLLDEINLLAEASPGFRWRLQDAAGNATQIRITDDPCVLVNMTLWATIEQLFAFTYRSAHKTVFARRFEWTTRWPGPNSVLWWQPASTIPTPEDGLGRLRLLAERGPCEEAFTFKHRFPPPDPA
jgi:hypothetical protein